MDRGGIVRRAKRPEGWVAPGPRPRGPGDREDLWPGPGEDLCYLTGDFRIFQLIDGHRWSLDDLATAWFALRQVRGREVRRTVDLGCGIGSVLLMTAWALPTARLLGIEAQDVSFGMARRSVAYNGVDDRIELRHGDIRDAEVTGIDRTHDLVTGTPPYFDRSAGIVSDAPQKGPCRFEFRGGVEAYFLAAERLLAPDGTFVVCESADQPARVEAAARAHAMHIEARLDVIPKEGKRPLFSVFACRRSAPDLPPPSIETLTVRFADARRTREYIGMREDMGIPP